MMIEKLFIFAILVAAAWVPSSLSSPGNYVNVFKWVMFSHFILFLLLNNG